MKDEKMKELKMRCTLHQKFTEARTLCNMVNTYEPNIDNLFTLKKICTETIQMYYICMHVILNKWA